MNDGTRGRAARPPSGAEEVGIGEVLRLLAYLSILTFCAVMGAGLATSPPSMGPDFYSPGILRLAMVLSGVTAPLFAYGALLRSRRRSVLAALLFGARAGIGCGAMLGLAVALAVMREKFADWVIRLHVGSAWGLALAGLFLGLLTGGFFGGIAGAVFNAIGRAAVFPAAAGSGEDRADGARG